MLNETQAQRDQRIFNHYYSRLANSHNTNLEIRYCVIEYLCQYPKINPVYMAQCLINAGYKILFNDTSISRLENKEKELAVMDPEYRKRTNYQNAVFNKRNP